MPLYLLPNLKSTGENGGEEGGEKDKYLFLSLWYDNPLVKAFLPTTIILINLNSPFTFASNKEPQTVSILLVLGFVFF